MGSSSAGSPPKALAAILDGVLDNLEKIVAEEPEATSEAVDAEPDNTEDPTSIERSDQD